MPWARANCTAASESDHTDSGIGDHRTAYRRAVTRDDVVRSGRQTRFRKEFRQVQCVDLSSNGFAYLATEEPPSDRLIVVLGLEPFICLSADVVRREEVAHQGQRMHRVACQFSGRVEAKERELPQS